ncbi:PREDICTED: transcription repressor OFP14-like [Populus euphratica]|uniref:Transcription repressor n=1 Tax=Populus euphratica TaxID=75702 RepID=A0AAJ6SZN3_POPEU|nr:PREDICTED: transcription repressor OFP14-like [Populus euphratica]
MSKKLRKSIQECLYKIKNPIQNVHFYPDSKKRVLRGCKRPRTLSFAIARKQNEIHNEEGEINKGVSATLSDVDRFLSENFSSLYISDDYGNYQKGSDHRSRGADQTRSSQEILIDSPRFLDPPLDLCSSHRFFVTPGPSSSLVEEARSSLTATSRNMGSTSTSMSTCYNNLNEASATVASNDIKQVRLPDDCIAAALTDSPSPYDDFRESMQEMVEEKLQNNGKVEWDFMEELLFCYLNVNEKTSHKFILNAYVDLIVGLRKNLDTGHGILQFQDQEGRNWIT